MKIPFQVLVSMYQTCHLLEEKTMKKIILLSFILCFFCPLSAFGASSPMVERHIFSPEPDGKGSHKSPMALKLEKQLMFTGVILSSQGKWAIIREKGQQKGEEVRGLRKEGDEIKGMVIKEIGGNFLILAGEGKEVRLNLYHEGKSRPAIAAGSESPPVSAEKPPKGTSAGSSKSRVSSTGAKSTSPYAQAPKPSSRGSEQKGITPPLPGDNPFEQNMPPNPFQQETPPNPFQQEVQNPFLKKEPNPFQQNTPPNPFQQDTPPNP